MKVESLIIAGSTALAFFVGCPATSSAAEAPRVDPATAQITILYDAFGKTPLPHFAASALHDSLIGTEGEY